MLGNIRSSRWLALGALLCAVSVAPAFAASGKPWLGVVTQTVDDDLRQGLDLRTGGALINSVVSGSPADRAGLREGDVIVRFDGRSVASPGALTDLVGASAVGRSARVEVERHGSRQSFLVRLGDRPNDTMLERSWTRDDDERNGDDDRRIEIRRRQPGEDDSPDNRMRHRIEIEKRDSKDGSPDVQIRGSKDGRPMTPEELEEFKSNWKINGLEDLPRMKELQGLHGMPGMPGVMSVGRGRLGVRIEDVDEDLAGALGLSSTSGVFVTEVLDDTPAQRAGLRKGDVITEVDGRSVRDAEALRSALADEEGSVSLTVVRRGSRRTIQATLDPKTAPRAFMWRGDGPDSKGGTWSWKQDGSRLAPEADRKGAANQDELQELRDEIRELRRQLEDLKNR